MNARRAGSVLLVGILLLAGVTLAWAAPPVAKTVPWAPNNPLIPHDTYPGKTVTLKGTSDVQGASIQFVWDFGDGSAPATGTVSNAYVVEATHVYSGPVGTVWTATLRITNTSTGEFATANYYVAMREKQLPVEVNIAIDEGLWYLHKTQTRTTTGGLPIGYWNSGYAGSGYGAVSALNVNAFETNGHLETGDAANPYTETVQRGMRYVFSRLVCGTVANQTNPIGTFNPDTNANGIGCYVNESYPFYQGGPFIDAIVASGTPDATTSNGGTNILGRRYLDIVRDLVDYYSYCQYDVGSYAGGWRYSCNQGPDNSAAQWGAIGLIPAEREWGIFPPLPVKQVVAPYWLQNSQNSSTGVFGYTSTGPIWGPYGTTPSGMVQLAWVGVGRGSSQWDKAETFMRNNFANCCGATVSVKDYYYGLFAFVKAMLLHATTDTSGNLVPQPLTLLQSSTSGVSPIDWYAAEVTKGDPTDGVARTLVDDQTSAGYWRGHNYDGSQYPLETAMAIIMLNRTIFTAGAPVAVISANPNPAVVGATITLDGSGSFHQDPTKSIVAWSWDLNNDGVFGDATGPMVTTSFPALGNYPVSLRVTDNSSPAKTADSTVTLLVSIPPVAPTADAGGPYNFCPDTVPWFLNGSASSNPDNGVSEPGAPGDFIKSYAWTLGTTPIATGAVPDVTGFFTAQGLGNYLVTLTVTDNTGTSFPSSGLGDLSDTDTAEVVVRSVNDPVCALCPRNVKAYPKITKIEVTWTYRPGAVGYNVYRSTISGGPYLKVGSSTQGLFVDTTGLVNNPPTTYFYVVREVEASGLERCQSNEASATLTRRTR